MLTDTTESTIIAGVSCTKFEYVSNVDIEIKVEQSKQVIIIKKEQINCAEGDTIVSFDGLNCSKSYNLSVFWASSDSNVSSVQECLLFERNNIPITCSSKLLLI